MALKTSSGSQILSPQHIRATGIERNRLVVSVVLGLVLLILTIGYLCAFFTGKEKEAAGLLAFVVTAFGLLVGRGTNSNS